MNLLTNWQNTNSYNSRQQVSRVWVGRHNSTLDPSEHAVWHYTFWRKWLSVKFTKTWKGMSHYASIIKWKCGKLSAQQRSYLAIKNPWLAVQVHHFFSVLHIWACFHYFTSYGGLQFCHFKSAIYCMYRYSFGKIPTWVDVAGVTNLPRMVFFSLLIFLWILPFLLSVHS